MGENVAEHASLLSVNQALLACFGLATFDNVVTMTMGTQHGDEYHNALLLKLSAAWHTEG